MVLVCCYNEFPLVYKILQSQPSRDDDGRERRHTGAGAGAAVFAVPGVASGTTGTKLIQQQPASAAIGERAAATIPEVMGNRAQQPKAAAAAGGAKKIMTTNPDPADGAMAAGQG